MARFDLKTNKMSESSQQRVLGLAELVRVILEFFSTDEFQHVREDEEGYSRYEDLIKERRACLWAAAQISSTFSSIALEILWRWMDDIKPLLDLHPLLEKSEGFHTVEKRTNNSRKLERFMEYGKRIRKLRLTRRDLVTDDPDLYRNSEALYKFLSEQLPGGKITPNLEELVYRSWLLWLPTGMTLEVEDGIQRVIHLELSLLIQPNIRTLHFDDEYGESEYIELQVAYSQLSLASSSDLKHLRELEIHSIILNQNMLDVLSTFRTLQNLTISVMLENNNSRLSFISNSSLQMPHLQKLRVFGNLQGISVFLQALSCGPSTYHPLRTVKVAFHDEDSIVYPGEVARHALIWTGVLSRFSSIRHITLDPAGYVPAKTHCRGLGGEATDIEKIIQPLFRLRHVDFLHFRLTSCLTVSNGIIRSIVNAWPKIDSLNFNYHSHEFPHVSISQLPNFSFLVQVAHEIPHLTDLTVSLKDPGEKDKFYTDGNPDHGLWTLCLGESSFRDTKRVLQLIDRLFPRLYRISCFSWSDSQMEHAQSMLEDIQTRRLNKRESLIRGRVT